MGLDDMFKGIKRDVERKIRDYGDERNRYRDRGRDDDDDRRYRKRDDDDDDDD